MTTKVVSFGPELMAALVQGSKDEKIVSMPYKEAVVARARMHSLRAAMRKEKHPLADIVAIAKVTIRWGPEVATSTSRKGVKYPTDNNSIVDLVISPRDSTFRKAFEKAGIKVEQPEATPVLPESEVETADQVLEHFIKDKGK